MAWEPSYVNDGLFNDAPSGNLTVPVDYARQIGNAWIDGDALLANYDCSKTFDAPNYLEWANASGKNFNAKMIGILDSHQGDPPHTNVILAAFTVKNPQGAQWYKQELVVYGSYSSDPTTHVEKPGEPWISLDYYYCEVSITRLARRVWATPTAIPTVTDLQVSTAYTNFNVVIQGDTSLESLYYFLSRALFCCGNAHFGLKYYFTVGFYTESNRQYYDFDSGAWAVDKKVAFAGVGLDIDYLEDQFGGVFEPEETDDPNEEPGEDGGGESGEGGGDGDHDKSEDNIPIPDLPPIGAADAGFVHMFKLTLTDMVSFARNMFESTMWQAIKNYFADPMDFIAGVMIMPFTPIGDSVRYPKFGNNIWPQAFTLVGNQFYSLDCGSLYIKKYYDSFLDYDSYTKIKIYLPYIGYRDLVADEVMGNTIHVVYHVDVATGDCVAFIEVSDGDYIQVTYQYQGNCGVRVPYGRQSFDAAVSASMQMLGGVLSTGLAVGGAVATGGALAPAAAGIAAAQISGQIGSMTASAVQGQKRTMERAGSMGGSAGYMGIQYPYIIRQIPNQSRPGNYRQLHGYPSNIGGQLRDFSGYTTIEHILLDGVVCTDAEKQEIMSTLQGGVII